MGLKRLVKKVTKPIGKAVKKIVPKELAGIMQVAAPLAGPYAPLVYAAGAYKQSGRINPIALATMALPYVGVAQGAAGAQQGFGIGNLRYGRFDPSVLGTVDGIKTARDYLGLRNATGLAGKAEDFLFGAPGVEGGTEAVRGMTTDAVDPTQGILGSAGQFDLKSGKLLSSADPKTGAIKLSPTKVATAVTAGLSLSQTQEQIEEEGEEAGLGSGEIARLQQEAAEMWEDFDTTAFKPKITAAIGGLMRKNLREGSKGNELPPDPTKPIGVPPGFKPKPIGPVLPNKDMASDPTIMNTLNDLAMDIFGKPYFDLTEREQLMLQEFAESGRPGAAGGGLMRSNYALGSMPTKEESGLGGLPIEADMRYTGGFMPYGAKEKADDVPARLSKNEFVFTADAVRAAGGGSVQKGAQRMYNTMKQLESMGKMA